MRGHFSLLLFLRSSSLCAPDTLHELIIIMYYIICTQHMYCVCTAYMYMYCIHVHVLHTCMYCIHVCTVYVLHTCMYCVCTAYVLYNYLLHVGSWCLTWWHVLSEYLWDDHTLLCLVCLQDGTDSSCGGTHGSIKHVDILRLRGKEEEEKDLRMGSVS